MKMQNVGRSGESQKLDRVNQVNVQELGKLSTPDSTTSSPAKSETDTFSGLQPRYMTDSSVEDEDEVSEVESFVMEQVSDLEEARITSSKFLLNESDTEVSVDPETQARLEALLEAAGIGKFATGDGKQLADPEVLKRLTSSVSCALDEAAAALTRMRTENQRPPPERSLVEACSDGDVGMVKKLLTEGKSVHETTEEGESLLSLACSAGYYELAQVLLAMNANVEDRGIKGDCTPLMEAASSGFTEIVQLLVHHGGDVNAQSASGNTPLMYACAGGHTEVVKILLDAGANIEDHNENGHTPLMEAASAGHVQVASVLLDRGAGINTHSNEFKESALTLACYKGYLDMVRFLLGAGADQEHKTDEMHTALMEASMDGHVEVARLLLDSGAQVNMPTDSFESPLTLAACGGHVDLAILLIERGANIEEVNDEGYTPLMEAAREGHEEMVSLLLAKGAYINAQTEETQETALTLACCGGFLDVADFLIQKGAEIELGASTPLMEAAQEGHIELVRYLLEHQASVNATTQTKDTALTYACENGHTEVAKLLLQYGANLEHESEGGRTPLMKACRAGHKCTVKFLLSRNANVNKQTTNNDHTPLSLASAGGHLSVVELLLAHQADPFHKLKDNSTMVMEAAKGGHANVVQLLLDFPHSVLMGGGGGGQVETSGGGGPLSPTALTPPAAFTLDNLAVLPSPPPDTSKHPPHLHLSDTQLSTSTSSPIGARINVDQQPPPQQPPQQPQNQVVCSPKPLPSATTSSPPLSTSVQQPSNSQKSLLRKSRLSLFLESTLIPDLIPQEKLERAVSGGGQVSQTGMAGGGMSGSGDVCREDTVDKGGTKQIQHLIDSQYYHRQQIVEELQRVEEELKEKSGMVAGVGGGNCADSPSLADLFPSACQGPQSSLVHVDGSVVDLICERIENDLGNSGSSLDLPLPRVTLESPLTLPSDVVPSTSISDRPKAKPAWKKEGKNTRKQQQQQLQQSAPTDYHHYPSLPKQAPLPSTHQHIAQEVSKQCQQDESLWAALKESYSNGCGKAVGDTKPVLSSFLQQQVASSNPSPPPVLQANGDAHHHHHHNNNSLPPPSDLVMGSGGGDGLVGADLLGRRKLFSNPLLSEEEKSFLEQVANPHLTKKDWYDLGVKCGIKDIKELMKVFSGTKNSEDRMHVIMGMLMQKAAQEASAKVNLAGTPPMFTVEDQEQIPVSKFYQPPSHHHHHQQQQQPQQPPVSGVSQPQQPVGPSPSTGTTTTGAVQRPAPTASIVPPSPPPPAQPPAQLLLKSPPPPPCDCHGYPGGECVGGSLCMDVDSATDSNNDTALTLACAGGHDELVELLLSRGANIEHRDKKGFTPLILAATAGHEKVVEILLNHSADMEAQSERTKDTPLSLACSGGRYEVVELLLQRGANKEHRNVSDYTPLSLAASGGYVNIIKLLLHHGAEINSRTGSKLGISPLMLAAMNGHTAAVKLLLDMGSDINAQIETNRNTALTLACFQGRHEVVSLLLDRKANVEHRAKTGLTPLMEAASGGYVEVGRVLLDKGADVNAPPVPSSRDTALTIAADKGHVRFVELLLSRNAQVEVKNKKGNSPLWLAANGGHLAVVELLFKMGADIDSQDNRKVSCLMAAFRKGHIKVVKWMVNHVNQFPSDQEMNRYISTVNDKELLEKCQECIKIIRAAKDQQAAKAYKNASILLKELDQEKSREENRRAAAARRRERKKKKKLEKRKMQEETVQQLEDTETTQDQDTQEEEQDEPNEIKVVTSPRMEPEEGDSGIDANSQGSCSSTEQVKPGNDKKKDRKKKKQSSLSMNSVTSTDNATNLSSSPEKKLISSSSLTKSCLKTVIEGKGLDKYETTTNTTTSGSSKSGRVSKSASASAVVNKNTTPSTTLVFEARHPAERDDFESTCASSDNHTKIKNNNYKMYCEDGALSACSKSSSTSCLSPKQQQQQSASAAAAAAKWDEGWKEVVRKYLNNTYRSKKVSVPLNAISRVIGRGGSNINAIRTATGAHIEVEKQSKGQGDRTITLKGSSEATKQAHSLITALIKDPDVDILQLLPKSAKSAAAVWEKSVNTAKSKPGVKSSLSSSSSATNSNSKVTSASSGVKRVGGAKDGLGAGAVTVGSTTGTKTIMSYTGAIMTSCKQQSARSGVGQTFAAKLSESQTTITPLMNTVALPPRDLNVTSSLPSLAPTSVTTMSASACSTSGSLCVTSTHSINSGGSLAGPSPAATPSIKLVEREVTTPTSLPTASLPPAAANTQSAAPQADLHCQHRRTPSPPQPPAATLEYSLFNDNFTKVAQQSMWGPRDVNVSKGNSSDKGMNFASVAAAGTIGAPSVQPSKYLEPTPPPNQVDLAKAPGYNRGGSVCSPVSKVSQTGGGGVQDMRQLVASSSSACMPPSAPSVSVATQPFFSQPPPTHHEPQVSPVAQTPATFRTAPPPVSAVQPPPPQQQPPQQVQQPPPQVYQQQDPVDHIIQQSFQQQPPTVTMSRLNPRAPDFSSSFKQQILNYGAPPQLAPMPYHPPKFSRLPPNAAANGRWPLSASGPPPSVYHNHMELLACAHQPVELPMQDNEDRKLRPIGTERSAWKNTAAAAAAAAAAVAAAAAQQQVYHPGGGGGGGADVDMTSWAALEASKVGGGWPEQQRVFQRHQVPVGRLPPHHLPDDLSHIMDQTNQPPTAAPVPPQFQGGEGSGGGNAGMGQLGGLLHYDGGAAVHQDWHQDRSAPALPPPLPHDIQQQVVTDLRRGFVARTHSDLEYHGWTAKWSH